MQLGVSARVLAWPAMTWIGELWLRLLAATNFNPSMPVPTVRRSPDAALQGLWCAHQRVLASLESLSPWAHHGPLPERSSTFRLWITPLGSRQRVSWDSPARHVTAAQQEIGANVIACGALSPFVK